MKYKVGETVEIKRNLVPGKIYRSTDGRYYSYCPNSIKTLDCRIGTIIDATRKYRPYPESYLVKVRGKYVGWLSDEMIMPYNENSINYYLGKRGINYVAESR